MNEFKGVTVLPVLLSFEDSEAPGANLLHLRHILHRLLHCPHRPAQKLVVGVIEVVRHRDAPVLLPQINRRLWRRTPAASHLLP